MFITGIVYGLYLTLSTWMLYHVSNCCCSSNGPVSRHICRYIPYARALQAACATCTACRCNHQLKYAAHAVLLPGSIACWYSVTSAVHHHMQVAAKSTFFEDSFRMFSLNDTGGTLCQLAT